MKARALVPAQQLGITQRPPGLPGSQHLGQSGNVRQTQVQALPCQRVHQVGAIAEQHETVARHPVCPQQPQRPAFARAVQAQLLAGLGHQQGFKCVGRQGDPLGGRRLWLGPHQGIAVPHGGSIQRQKGEHFAGVREPLPGSAQVRQFSHQSRGNGVMPVGALLHAHPKCLPTGRLTALAKGQQLVRNLGLHALHMRGKANGRLELGIQLRGINNPSEFLGLRIPSAEIKLAAARLHAHVGNRGAGMGWQTVPHLEPREQALGGRVERVGTHILSARRVAAKQRHTQALRGQCQRKRAPHTAIAADQDLMLHGRILGSRPMPAESQRAAA